MKNHIVVGIDSSAAAHAALRWAYAQASTSGQDVLALRIVDDCHPLDPAGQALHDRADHAELRGLTQARVLAALPVLDESVRLTISTAGGSLVGDLVEASLDAAMVVIGEPQCAEHAGLPTTLAYQCYCPVVQVSADSTVTPLAVNRSSV